MLIKDLVGERDVEKNFVDGFDVGVSRSKEFDIGSGLKGLNGQFELESKSENQQEHSEGAFETRSSVPEEGSVNNEKQSNKEKERPSQKKQSLFPHGDQQKDPVGVIVNGEREKAGLLAGTRGRGLVRSMNLRKIWSEVSVLGSVGDRIRRKRKP